ncbi:response regulator [Paraburkholderia phosphatilytica]|uniref:response regulator n=1 Tax=Paraburkholderia phosphatilytica TaxID=2282883 RepID=UPI000E4A98DA|nr:response regulator [Paraburkholderia phosphatilytica]
MKAATENDQTGTPAREGIPESWLLIAIAALTALVFVLDCFTPLGFAVWILYLAPIAIGLLTRRPLVPLLAAAVATVFMIAGFFVSGNAHLLNHNVVLFNRVFGVVSLWCVAGVGTMYIRSRVGMDILVRLQRDEARVTQRTRGIPTPPALGAAVLDALAPLVDAQIGALYMIDEGALQRVATWAFPDASTAPATIPLGEGLVGQAVKDNRRLLVAGTSHAYLRISSAVLDGAPAQVLIVPLTAEGDAIGALELGFVGRGRALDEVERLLARVAENVGMALRSARYRGRLEELLAQTQRQSDELQTQQEELRVSNEELEERGRMLMDSQARLETQQSELEETNAQLEEHSQWLERQKSDLERAQRELGIKAEELEQANRYKSQFLANMSHELRTPLNSSLILAKLLQENRTGNLSAEQVRYAETIHASNSDLLALINDILDLSKVEAGQVDVDIAPVPLDAMLQSLRQTFAPVAREKGIGLAVERMPGAPDSVESDGQRIVQVLRNLLSNAIKFTSQGEVRLTVSRGDEGVLRIDVRDSGIGIAPDKLDLIFEAFQQADGTTSRKYGGSGLGLSISREFAHLLGGEITVASELGKGSVFTLTLPERLERVARGDDTADAAAAAAKQPAARTLATPATQPLRSFAATVSAARDRAMAADAANGRASARAGSDEADGYSPGSAPHSRAANPALPTRTGIPDDRDNRTRGERLILAIEDDTAFAGILRDLAHEMEFDFVHAADAASGLALARDLNPAAVLLDVGLPDQSGLTVLEWLKSDGRTRHIPIHIVSVDDHAEKALHLGAIGYTLKPTARETLAAAIGRLEARLEQRVRRVLVVEDDAAMRESIRALLHSATTEIVTAATLAEALTALGQSDIDCVVTDLALPDGTGYDLLERLAAEPSHAALPVIVYTGRMLSDDEEQRLRRFSKSIIIKGAKSPERLLDEVTLFLHSVESQLPPEQQRMLQVARQRDNAFEGRTILLAEDDVRNIFALSHVLEPLGATLEIARNGREALDKLQGETRIDLVLMDVMMPEMDGLAAIREIRREAKLAQLPVIALTAKAMADDRQRCLQAGADDYIAKPIDVDKLISLCRVWLRRR